MANHIFPSYKTKNANPLMLADSADVKLDSILDRMAGGASLGSPYDQPSSESKERESIALSPTKDKLLSETNTLAQNLCSSLPEANRTNTEVRSDSHLRRTRTASPEDIIRAHFVMEFDEDGAGWLMNVLEIRAHSD